MKTRVVNLREEKYDFYIGRGTPLGNPYKITKGRTREEAVELYRQLFKTWLKCPDFAAYVEGLRGRVFGCYCKPLLCHGDVIVEYLEGKE